ncbi:hypothetical protein OTB20_08505 [Streptomyces sp. H27-H1]|uniref:hypothetical protein n=1 Tax=Streptomyces sp. H27-H1 TaxID=2996461 RepID=UPI00226E77EC|nr:hypothetical protein [Streptomyces sp. H27-H1]MCY0926246.1 hypothetical protein [Streptomyces sp. H27-H1]
MAKIKSAGTVDVELTIAELEIIRRVLRVVPNSDAYEDSDAARNLLADLSELPS